MKPTLGLLLLLGLAGLGCQAQTVRKMTYPGSFHYLEKNAVSETMRGLAKTLRELDDAVRAPAPDSAAILALLTVLQDNMANVEPGLMQTHPEMGLNVGSFLRDVEGAKSAIASGVQNLGLAGQLTGACRYCH